MAKKTITLSTDGRWVQKEEPIAEVITPGDLVELNVDGYFQRQSTAAIAVMPMFAVENDLAGETIDTDYAASGDQCRARIFSPGGEVYAWLADGETAVVGSMLEASGQGTFRVLASGIAIAQALEAVDLSASGTATRARIKIRVL